MTGRDFVSQNENVEFTCTTAVSNPRADVEWFIGSQQMSTIEKNYQSQPGGGWVTISKCKFKATSSLHNKVITCRAWNEPYPKKVVATRSLNVHCELGCFSITHISFVHHVLFPC
ncbi:hypothetical protein EGW08_012833 [Elysia chlorotica]|uniref:Ig-like domain-containing protein n=1 Tax=Elysia chlorotica TaxID=188477 RepID=A0A3S1B456_ELYCH|nr:hypothetical protein EGW08_012833 [Elysia chlorotica]